MLMSCYSDCVSVANAVDARHPSSISGAVSCTSQSSCMGTQTLHSFPLETNFLPILDDPQLAMVVVWMKLLLERDN